VTEILIHRCTLRVVRRSGWGWGEDPKQLVQELVRNFPALLARKLTALLPDEDGQEFASPIRLRIPVRITELLRGVVIGPDRRGPDESQSARSFEHRLDTVIRAAFSLGTEPDHEAARSDRFAWGTPISAAISGRVRVRGGSALERLLLGWVRESVLEGRVAVLSEDQIASWHDALSGEGARHGIAAASPEPSLSSRIDAIVGARAGWLMAQTPTDRLRQRILLATEAAEQLDISLTHFLLWRALDRELPLNRPSPVGDAVSMRDGAAAITDAPMHAAQPLVPRPRSVQASDWDVKIDCALPFVLLGPLTRLGYIDAVSAVLEGAKLTDETSLFAAALAYKVLDPPERGWRRCPASVLAAAAFAGSRDAVNEGTLVDFSRRIAPHTGALDLVLAGAVIGGHVPGEPVVLRRMDTESATGLLLVDTPGCFPVAYANGVEPLLPVLRRLGEAVLMISSESASPRLLKDLNAAGLIFVTDVPPTRHEAWRRVQQGALRLGWTNSLEPGSEPVLSAARKLTASCDEAEDLWRELAVARPGVVRAYSPELDRSLTLAAAVAMGIAAWKLWPDAGSVNPQKALHRYCDLDARVRFDRDSVLVSLPLGRRHQELDEAGLLAPVNGVPWLDGRRIDFGGG
jgi:hypothetical protein